MDVPKAVSFPLPSRAFRLTLLKALYMSTRNLKLMLSRISRDLFECQVGLGEARASEEIDALVSFVPKLRLSKWTAVRQIAAGTSREYSGDVAVPRVRLCVT